VLIPEANVRHLVLRRDVIEAVAQGWFHIYPARTVDDGLQLLAGIPGASGRGIESIHEAAARRLKEPAVELKEFAVSDHNGAAVSNPE